MNNETTPLHKLKQFLNELFQFESQDLDFGVYKILHYKRNEIKHFIEKLLVDDVNKQLISLSADETRQLNEQISDLEKEDIIKAWTVAEGDEKKTLEKFGKDKINLYKELTGKATEVAVSVETENQIYNHLTLFFSRYYDKGDFISKRRFGKNEKYMVPYNGEETHFHWANHDQYYIKSSETFNHYAFKSQNAYGEVVVHFKLDHAQMEQGNVKANEPNYFLLAEKEPEFKENEFTIYFEYRPLTEEDKSTVKGNNKQDALDVLTYDSLKKDFGSNPNFVNLWKDVGGKPLLLKKLHHYTRKNKHDFFIHKNLKGFLTRELDYYIKSELVNVDDLYVSDSDAHFSRLKHNLKTIKVFKSIADTIIDFVSQIEDFQRKLWEKKKFVLSTEWVITIDRLVDYIGEDAAKPILETVIKNKKQVAEWKDLFGEKSVPKNLDDFRFDLHTWKKLPIDTHYFVHPFKKDLLNALSERIDLGSNIDGFLILSDNFHGLNLLHDTWSNIVKMIYIDPPYNTGDDEFIYKDNYMHSTWSSMIHDRLIIARDLIRKDGAIFTSIDEKEHKNLAHVLDLTWGSANFISDLVWAGGRKNDSKLISVSHEYMRVYAFDKEHLNSHKVKWHQKKKGLDNIYKTYKLLKKKYKKDYTSISSDLKLWFKELPDSHPAKAHKHYSQVDANGIYFPADISWPGGGGPMYDVFHPITNKPVKVPARGWMTSDPSNMQRWIDDNLVHFGEDESSVPCMKSYLVENEYQAPYSVFYQDGRAATKRLKHILGHSDFGYPKDENVISECIEMLTSTNDVVLDFFAGSGTTFHSVQNIIKLQGIQRKTILMEQGLYVHTTIIPRIKKIAYTFDWKDGRPKDGSMNGLGVFFKYQRLEQYEEALENIAFKASKEAVQKAMEFDQYIPKYFLEFETKGSQTLVNTAAMQDPWDYKLKVWDGFTYDIEQAVDLVETFNYLIGLHMQKCITKDIGGKKYQIIFGHNNANKNILVIWRSVKDWTLDDYKTDAESLKIEMKAFTYDLLYINDQAHIEGYQPIEDVFKNKMVL